MNNFVVVLTPFMQGFLAALIICTIAAVGAWDYMVVEHYE